MSKYKQIRCLCSYRLNLEHMRDCKILSNERYNFTMFLEENNVPLNIMEILNLHKDKYHQCLK